MKSYSGKLLLFLLLLIGAKTSAQQRFTISGLVTDSAGVPQKAATVFLSGTKYITATDAKGEFRFESILPGTYQLSVSMIGFTPYSQSLVVQRNMARITVPIKAKTETLREVVIGAVKPPSYMYLFRKAFIGESENAVECKIMNPDVLHFHYNKTTSILTVNADDFLLLESGNLGYRIKYLLKDFRCNTILQSVLYDGETSFEEMPGTEHQKKVWAKNRLKTYNGSMMHFLRSVYQHQTKKQGFLVYNIYNLDPAVAKRLGNAPIEIDIDPINVNKLTTPLEGGLIGLNFNALYVDYFGTRSTDFYSKKTDQLTRKIGKGEFGSVLKLLTPQAVIDSRGSYSDYHTFYLQGFMGDQRVGDQLPFEYEPPVKK